MTDCSIDICSSDTCEYKNLCSLTMHDIVANIPVAQKKKW